jgi:hypothetical protein
MDGERVLRVMASAMTDADDFRKQAEEARQMAARSLKQED